MTDADLLQRAAQGGEAEIAELYDRYAPLVYAIARSLGADADGVVLDTFDAALQTAGRQAGVGSLTARMVAIARARSLVEQGERAARPAVRAGSPVEAALRQLTVTERETVELAMVGANEGEIGKRLEEGPATVRAALRSGMAKLREAFRARPV